MVDPMGIGHLKQTRPAVPALTTAANAAAASASGCAWPEPTMSTKGWRNPLASPAGTAQGLGSNGAWASVWERRAPKMRAAHGATVGFFEVRPFHRQLRPYSLFFGTDMHCCRTCIWRVNIVDQIPIWFILILWTYTNPNEPHDPCIDNCGNRGNLIDPLEATNVALLGILFLFARS